MSSKCIFDQTRSSHLEVLFEKAVLKNISKFIGNWCFSKNFIKNFTKLFSKSPMNSCFLLIISDLKDFDFHTCLYEYCIQKHQSPGEEGVRGGGCSVKKALLEISKRGSFLIKLQLFSFEICGMLQ